MEVKWNRTMWGICMGIGLPLAASAQFSVSGSLEDWESDGPTWRLSALEAGASYLVFCPQTPPDENAGLLCKIRWKQNLSGSASNFSRLHWLTACMDTLPAAGWTNESSFGTGSFLHLGETGGQDSVRWYGIDPAALGASFDPLAQTQYAAMPEPTEFSIEWQQPPDMDSTWVLIQPWENGVPNGPVHLLAAGPHPIPAGWGFSARYTASHTSDFEVELLEWGPWLADSVAPEVHRHRATGPSSVRWDFSEPLGAWGAVRLLNDSVPLPLAAAGTSLHEVEHLVPGPWPAGSSLAFHVSGFCDLQGNPMNDTTVIIYQTDPMMARAGDLMLTEICADGLEGEEWVEILNTSIHAHRVSDFLWYDGSTETLCELSPIGPWDGMLIPGQRAVILISGDPLLWSVPRLMQPTSPVTLNNGGETLEMLRPDGETMCKVSYHSTWKPSSSSSHFRLQKRHLTACNHAQNWLILEDGEPGTPGTSSPHEHSPLHADSLQLREIFPWNSHEGAVRFSQPLMHDQAFTVRNGIAWSSPNDPYCVHWNLQRAELAPSLELALSPVIGCFSHPASTSIPPVSFHAYRSPQPGEVIITEIAHQPEGHSAPWGTFVEILNVHPADTLEVTGCSLNEQFPNQRMILSPGERSCFWELPLGKESGTVILRNAMGQELDAVEYRSCWHRKRTHSGRGFSLVRVGDSPGYVPVHSWREWDSCPNEHVGCSPGFADAWEAMDPSGEVAAPSLPVPTLCGTYLGKRVLLLEAPTLSFAPNWQPLQLSELGTRAHHVEPLTLWMEVENPQEYACALCPPPQQTSFPAAIHLNEIRSLTLDGAEPFIELANASQHWSTTRDWFWTTDWLAFPDDWAPISPDIEWFLPPYSTVAWSACPQRIESTGAVVGVELPSVWSDFVIQLAHGGSVMDSVRIGRDRWAAWHGSHHSLERISTPPDPPDDWNSALTAKGHSAGEWNSWQTLPVSSPTTFVNVIHPIWHRDASGNIIPITVDVMAPGAGWWSVRCQLRNGLGMEVAAFEGEPRNVGGEGTSRIQWDGQISGCIAAPGTYLLNLHFERHSSTEAHTVTVPVHVAPL